MISLCYVLIRLFPPCSVCIFIHLEERLLSSAHPAGDLEAAVLERVVELAAAVPFVPLEPRRTVAVAFHLPEDPFQEKFILYLLQEFNV